jgi:hypothetical protein
MPRISLPALGSLFSPVPVRSHQPLPDPPGSDPSNQQGLAQLPWASDNTHTSSIFDLPAPVALNDWQQEMQSLFPNQAAEVSSSQPFQPPLSPAMPPPSVAAGRTQPILRPAHVAPTPPKVTNRLNCLWAAASSWWCRTRYNHEELPRQPTKRL